MRRFSQFSATLRPRPQAPRPASAFLSRARGRPGGVAPALGAVVSDLCAGMEKIAPTHAAEEWDNVGLLVGDFRWPVERVLLTIDLTPAVLGEAVEECCDAVVSYHPPIRKSTENMIVESLTAPGLASKALAERIAVYSPHTALDAVAGGTNDVLAELAGLTDVRPLQPVDEPDRQYKLVIFVPPSHLEEVAEALFAAGAGVIGDYRECSYRLSGYGTFRGGETTKPAVGEKGRLERVEEVRLEVVFSAGLLNEVVAAIHRTHPYEEPAYDIYPLLAQPSARLGQGRIGRFSTPVRVRELARLLRNRTKATTAAIVGNPNDVVERGIVCVGAAGEMPFQGVGERACGRGDVVITGEIRHHHALRYERYGVAAVALGHWASERPVLAPLAAKLKNLLPGVYVAISRADRDPFRPA